MTKALSAEVVIADLDYEVWAQRLPFARAGGGPTARPTRPIAGEARRRYELLQLRGQRLLLAGGDRRGEPDVMQQPVSVIEPKQQRSDYGLAFVVAKAANDAVGAAISLY